jgi:hypothetical protein
MHWLPGLSGTQQAYGLAESLVHPYARAMTDQSASAEPRAGDSLAARLDCPLTDLMVHELMELKAEFEARGIRIYNGVSPGTARTSRWSDHLCQGVLGDLGKAQRRGV